MAIFDNLLAYYPFSGYARDVGGNDYHGTVSEATAAANHLSIAANAYLFDGVDDYIELDDGLTPLSFDISGKEATATGLFFKSDGTMFFVTGQTSDEVHAYTMSTAWDVRTATFTASSTIVAAKEATPSDLGFSSDGTKMYVLGTTGQDITYFTCGAWDVSTLVYVGEFSVAAQDTVPRGLAFNDDGTKFYVAGDTTDAVYQYSMTAWNMSTAAYASKTISVAGEDATPTGIFFKSDGSKMYILGQVGDDVNMYTLSTPRDVSTATADNMTLYVGNQETNPGGLFFKDDGLKMFTVGTVNDTVYSYTLSTAWTFSDLRYQNGFTISTWIKPTTVGETNGRILDKSSGGNGSLGFEYYTLATNKVALKINVGTAIASASGSVVFGDGNWYHVAVTVGTDSTITHYINGAANGTPAISDQTISKITCLRKSRIGNRSDNTDAAFDGTIGKTIIWGRALTAIEIEEIYKVQLGNMSFIKGKMYMPAINIL